MQSPSRDSRFYHLRQLQLELLGEVPVLSIRTEPLQNQIGRASCRERV